MPLTNSDSEGDLDYVPPAEDNDSDSSDDQDELGMKGSVSIAPLQDPAEQKKQRDALWASFQASIATPPSNGSDTRPPEVKRVTIEKTYLFAGKHVTEVVEVPEDSEEAKKWPRWSPPSHTSGAPAPAPSPNEKSEGNAVGEAKDKSDDKNDNSTLSPTAPSPAPPTTATPIPGTRRPGPRKSRVALPPIPNKASQAKKITTLDKSAMDWRSHVASQSSDLKDELDANKRGGGYLEKMEFLKRVEDRREDAFEASKASKRRKV